MERVTETKTETKTEIKLVRFGYVRVSTKEQSIDRQLVAIKNYKPISDCNIFTDVYTGKTFDRENYQKMKSIIEYQLQVIDDKTCIEVVVKELDRLGRNKDKIKDEIKWFKEHGVILRVLNIPTTLLEIPLDNKWVFDMVNNILIEVYSSIAQQEVETREQRQREGTLEAKKRGVKFGRPTVDYDNELFNLLYVKWKNNEITAISMMNQLKLSRTTFYRRVKEYEMNNGVVK